MHRRMSWIATLAAFGLVAGCGLTTSDEDEADRTSATDGDGSNGAARTEPLPAGLDVCGLVSEETIDEGVELIDDDRYEDRYASVGGQEVLVSDAESFIGCQQQFGENMRLWWGVRDTAVVSGPPAATVLHDEGDIETIELDGFEARVAGREYTTVDGDPRYTYRLIFEVDGLEVLVTTGTLHGETDESLLGYVHGVAQDIEADLDGTAPEPVDMGEHGCPAADNPDVVEMLDGEARVARSRGAANDEETRRSVTCEYATDRVTATLTHTQNSEGLEAERAGSNQERDEFAGAPASVQSLSTAPVRGRVVVDGECAFEAEIKPVGQISAAYTYLLPSDDPTATEGDVGRGRETRAFSGFEALATLDECGV